MFKAPHFPENGIRVAVNIVSLQSYGLHSFGHLHAEQRYRRLQRARNDT